VAAAFHTAIHYLDVGGVTHFANMSDPQIPAALAPAVVGVVSLHNFRPRPQLSIADCKSSDFQVISSCYWVSPADLATIYNFNPVYNAGNTGQNQTIYLVEDTNLYNPNDWTTFRSLFGLSRYGATLTTIHPPSPIGFSNCADPGVNASAGEATLDVEWSSAAAPSAAIVLASCADTSTTSGILIVLHNLINGAIPPAIISDSYGECEAKMLAAANAAQYAIFQQGVAQGTSIFVAAGDEGAAGCDHKATIVRHGINVNGAASTPYNVAVGGTDFGDTYAKTNSTYWSSTNSVTWRSALSYIPEIPWDDTCASSLLAMYKKFSTTYGSSGSCNSGGDVGALVEPWGGEAVGRAAAPPVRPPYRGSSAAPVPDTRSRSGRPEYLAFRTTACATFPMSRCTPPRAHGGIRMCSATPPMAIARTPMVAPRKGDSARRRRRRSWLGSRH
jgi:subtilase family serine protease